MKFYINPDKSKTFREKPSSTQKLINTTLFILEEFGIPMGATPRRLERIAMAFLSCGEIKKIKDFKNPSNIGDGFSLKTREIIEFINANFNERISSGSYDDIRRKDLKLLTVADIVLQSNPNSATNDSTRGYSLNPFYANILKRYGEPGWQQLVADELKNVEPIRKKLKRERDLIKVSV